MRRWERLLVNALYGTVIVAAMTVGSAFARVNDPGLDDLGVEDLMATDIIIETESGVKTISTDYHSSTERLLAKRVFSKIYQTDKIDFRDTLVPSE